MLASERLGQHRHRHRNVEDAAVASPCVKTSKSTYTMVSSTTKSPHSARADGPPPPAQARGGVIDDDDDDDNTSDEDFWSVASSTEELEDWSDVASDEDFLLDAHNHHHRHPPAPPPPSHAVESNLAPLEARSSFLTRSFARLKKGAP